MFRICLPSSTNLYDYVCFAYVFFRKEGTCCWFQRELCTSTKDSHASAGQSLPSALLRWTSPETSLCGSPFTILTTIVPSLCWSPFTILRTIVRILNCRSQHCQVCRVWLWKHMPQHVLWIGLLAKRTQSGFEHACETCRRVSKQQVGMTKVEFEL